jgi:hypothetical protein
MNQIKLLALAAFAACIFTAARAADYAVQANFWTATSITNVTAIATNLNAAIEVKKTDSFTIQAVLAFTNACAGTYDIQWTCSADGVTYVSAPAAPGASGWFSIPLTNGGAVVTWVTNISMGPCGYFRINYGTNQAGQSLTNASILGYVKPNRTSKDY